MDYRLDIVMACPGMPFNGETTGALGGSETACRDMAAALSRRGHNVTVFSNTDSPGHYNGVNYMHLNHWQHYAAMTPHDVSVVQRIPEFYATQVNSRLNVLWNHDLAQKANENAIKGSMWNIDKIYSVSEWHRHQIMDTFDFDGSDVVATSNGIDPELVKQATKGMTAEDRDPNKLIYAARPERGLDYLLDQVLPKLLEKNPDYYLCIAGYDNPSEQMAQFYGYIDQLIASYGDKVQWLGHLSKDELYRQYASAGAYVYPTPSPIMPEFREVSCISAMEAMACGLPFISTDCGALPETLKEGKGELVPMGEGYLDRFVEAVTSATNRTLAPDTKTADALSWDRVAKQWEDDFKRWISERNQDNERLARDMIRHSDIAPAMHLADRATLSNDVQETLDKYRQITSDLPAHYNQMDKGFTEEDFENTGHQSRLQYMINFLGGLPDRKTVFDFGCSYGAYLIHMANQFPDKEFVGYDFDRHAIKRANELADQYAQHGNVKFVTDPESYKGWADVLFCCEVLEHTMEPWAVADEAEQYAHRGAAVYVTVPFGPWEHQTDTYEHLWHLDAHDIRDMFSGKRGVALSSLTHHIGGPLHKPHGWWVVAWEVSDQKSGAIDMERHLTLQRPRQTVSASLIAGETADKQIRWTLDSLQRVVDEIVIVDCGMSETALTAAEEYGATIVDGVDPKITGFEVARNLSLPHCHMDWVLWIDCDERLVSSHQLHKYLRESMYHGFGVQQHHFAVDTTFDPDKPVRLFRNRPHKGKEIQWYGAVHEHPELELNAGPGPTLVLSDAHIAHTGYLDEPIRQERFKRNNPLMDLDRERYPERILQKQLIMRDNLILVRDRMQVIGGMDQYCVELCNEVIDLYKEYFEGNPGMWGDAPAESYSKALEILGEGVSPEQVKESGAIDALAFRHASVDDLVQDFRARLEQATG